VYLLIYFQHSLILPPRNNKQKRSHIHDSSYNGKCRKTDILLSPPGSNNKEISNLTEKNILEILNTPLEEKIISLPSNAICSSILKVCFITLNEFTFNFS